MGAYAAAGYANEGRGGVGGLEEGSRGFMSPRSPLEGSTGKMGWVDGALMGWGSFWVGCRVEDCGWAGGGGGC